MHLPARSTDPESSFEAAENCVVFAGILTATPTAAAELTDAQCEAIYQAVLMASVTRDVKSPERKRQVVRDAARHQEVAKDA